MLVKYYPLQTVLNYYEHEPLNFDIPEVPGISTDSNQRTHLGILPRLSPSGEKWWTSPDYRNASSTGNVCVIAPINEVKTTVWWV